MSLRRPSFENADSSSEINISPLIDVVFILLVFFVVTMAFAEKSALDIDRPKSDRASESPEKALNVFVEKNGKISVDGAHVSVDSLEKIASLRREKNAVIDSDSDVKISTIVEIMDACSRAGVEKVFIASDKRKDGGL